MEQFDSYELTPFNLKEHIVLTQKFGLLKILKSDDGKLILVAYADYGLIDQAKPSPAKIANQDAILGFVMDIGVRRERRLTVGSGFYFGSPLINTQSDRPIGQKDFDQTLFEKITNFIEDNYQSGDPIKELAAIKTDYLLETYNNARLLYPNFYNESYLSLMRIIDAITKSRGASEFALSVAQVSPELNEEIYKKISTIPTYTIRLEISKALFDECLQSAQSQQQPHAESMKQLDEAARFIFASFYSAYQYRNKFVHHGIPFPDTVKHMYDPSEDFGTNYLNPAEGMSHIKRHTPNGVEEGDLIDFHSIVGNEQEVANFKDKYFKLIPTWHFVKRLTRKALIQLL